MDAHDERMTPRPGPHRPGVGQGPAGADPGPDPAGSGRGPDDGRDPASEPGHPGQGPDGDAPSPAADPATDDVAPPAGDDSADTSRSGSARSDSASDQAHGDVHPTPEAAPSLPDEVTGTEATGTEAADTAPATDTTPPPTDRLGIAGLSFRYQVVAAVALAAVAVTACVHLAMVFLSVAPENTMTKQHGQLVDDWVLPEFEQNWKLFAPNPLQQNIAVEARAQVRTASGGLKTTGWYNISALDGAAIDGNPLPSHTQQNELRRAWDFFVSTHDNQNHGTGLRSNLSESYLRRIIVLRLHRLGLGDAPSGSGQSTGRDKTIEQVQIRSMTTNVQPPAWSGTGPYSDKPVYRTLSWWPVGSADLSLDAASAPGSKDTTTEAKPR